MLYQPSNDVTRPRAGRQGQTILLLEDEARLRCLHREVLQAEGFTVLEAAGLARAMRLGDSSSIDILVADVGAGGVPAATALRRRHPGMRVILTSGSHREPEHQLGAGVPFLRKPVGLALLLAAVETAANDRPERT